MTKHGGYRPGSGRKPNDPNTIAYQKRKVREIKQIAKDQARTIMVEEILDHWRPLIRTRIKIALGQTKVIEIDGKRETVYTVPPNDRAIENIVSYIISKPKWVAPVDTPQLDRIGEAMELIISGKADRANQSRQSGNYSKLT